MSDNPLGKGERYGSLESVRGLAALSVVFSHLVLTYEPHLKDPAGFPLSQFWHNGEFAVRLFFVLSGFVLSLTYCRYRDLRILQSAALRRYFRLLLPITGSVGFAYAMVASGLYRNIEFANLLGRPDSDWIRTHSTSAPSIADALGEGFFRALFNHNMDKTLNPVLWTMTVEFFGSLFVFAVQALADRARNRWLLYGVIAVALYAIHRDFLVDFLAGLALAEAHVSRGEKKGGRIVWTALFLLGIAIGDIRIAWFKPPGQQILWIQVSRILPTLGAVFVVAGALKSPLIRRALECKPLLMLGSASFCLYLFHLPLLCSVATGVHDWAIISGVSPTWSEALGAVSCLVCSLGVAALATVTLDRGSIALARFVDDGLFRRSLDGEGWSKR